MSSIFKFLRSQSPSQNGDTKSSEVGVGGNINVNAVNSGNNVKNVVNDNINNANINKNQCAHIDIEKGGNFKFDMNSTIAENPNVLVEIEIIQTTSEEDIPNNEEENDMSDEYNHYDDYNDEVSEQISESKNDMSDDYYDEGFEGVPEVELDQFYYKPDGLEMELKAELEMSNNVSGNNLEAKNEV